jgi:hypothetical protein
MEQVQEAFDQANQRLATEGWTLVENEAREKIEEYEKAFERVAGLADDLLRAVAVAVYVVEQAVVTIKQVNPDDPYLVGVPKKPADGPWRDAGRFDQNRTALVDKHRQLVRVVKDMEEKLVLVVDWYKSNDPDEDPVDESTKEMLDAFAETLGDSQELWSEELVDLAREVHRLHLATIACRDALKKLPTRPPIRDNFEEPKWVNEDAPPRALLWSPESKSEKDRGASPVTAPSPTPQITSPSGNAEAYKDGMRQQIESKPGKEHLIVRDMTPCEYFEKHMRTADPILLTWYSFDAIEKDWKWWRSQNPPQMPTMNTVFIKKTFFDWNSAYTGKPVPTSEAIKWVVDHSMPQEGVDAEWRSKRAGERFFVVDGTNLFYKDTVEEWDQFKRVVDIQKDKVPVGRRYGPIIIVIQSHVFEDKVLKYNHPNAQFLSDTGIRLMYNLLRPLHGGHDYPIHIVEICAELCKHSFAKKSGDNRFPCIDMVKDGDGVSLCRLLDRDKSRAPREHRFCEYDDAVGTLVKTALEERQGDVVVVTGEGGNERERGVRKYLKSNSDMRAIWEQMQSMSTRATTRVYRMGYNRAVRLYAEHELRAEGALDALVDAV